MTPVIIPSPGGDCFAVYGEAPGPAVLICPSFGDEALKTARLWRDLSVRLGKQGLATLRFDLPGTGNSAGAPTDSDRVDAWRAAVRSCAAWLAARHDDRVILFGHRFGALLVLDYAASGLPLERVVLLDPPVNGGAVSRYFRARAKLEQTGPLPEGPDYIQVGGLPLSATTLEAIATLPAAANASLPPALLVLTELRSSPWPEQFRRHGSEIEIVAFDGYDDFMLHDAFQATPPNTVLDSVIDYLVRTAGPIGSRSQALPPPAELSCDGFSEMSIRFGPDDRLFGILCRPDVPATNLPALLFPSTGIDPCSGMSRMWTELARRLGRLGVSTLRFDTTGVGESGGTLNGNLLKAIYHVDRVADLRSAIDALADYGFDHVNIVGYCSGAYAAWHAAVSDTRINSILAGNLLYLNDQPSMIDEVLHLPPGSSQIGLKGSRSPRWMPSRGSAALRRVDERARRLVPKPIRNILRRHETDPKMTRRHVRSLIERGCSVSLVMARDDHGHIRLRRAFGERPRLPDGVELHVIADADHTFSDRRHRARFLDLAEAFALSRTIPKFTTKALPIAARKLEAAL